MAVTVWQDTQTLLLGVVKGASVSKCSPTWNDMQRQYGNA